MSWTAIVPLKAGCQRKSRLAARLGTAERVILSDHMAAHVLARLQASPLVGRIIMLSPMPVDAIEWRRDEGRGLNDELTAAAAYLGWKRLLVMHPDLPLLTTDDVDYLLTICGDGCALATDRHGSGTNALALAMDRPFPFSFGEDSAVRHRLAAGGAIETVHRPGLSLDIDTPEDLDAAIAEGFRLSFLRTSV